MLPAREECWMFAMGQKFQVQKFSSLIRNINASNNAVLWKEYLAQPPNGCCVRCTRI